MVIFHLVFAGFAGRNNARSALARRVADHQHPTQGIHTQGQESLLAKCIGVFYRDGEGVQQDLFGMGKPHSVFAQIALGLGWIELKYDGLFMHT